MDEQSLAPTTEPVEVVPQAEQGGFPSDTGAPAPEVDNGDSEQQKVAEAARTLNERKQRNREAAERRVTEERDSYRRLAEMAVSALQRGQQAPVPQQPQAPQAPQREQFNSYDDFVEAKAAFAAERRADEILTRRMQEAGTQYQRAVQEQQAQAIESDHRSRVAQFARQVPDFGDVCDRDDIIVPDAAANAIKRMPDNGAILYAIGKNPAIAAELQRMEPQQQMVYVGQLSSFLRSQGSQLSNAAPAGRTVGAKPSGGGSLPDDTEAYMAAANKKFGKR